MPGPYTAAEQELINIFQEGSAALQKQIEEAEIKGNSSQFQRALKNQIDDELEAMTEKADAWAEKTLPEMYKAGITETNSFLNKTYKEAGKIAPGFPDAFAVIHREALNTLVNKTTITLNMAIEGAGRRLDDAIRAAGQEAIKTKIITGSTVTKTKKLLVQKLKAEGLKVIPKKDGSSMSLEAYSELVARSTTREATNLGSITQVQAVGGDLVKMTEHYPTCPVCLPLQGRVYSISGTSKEYPPLGRAYTGQYANIHPNCRHVLNPYIPEFKTPEELEADKKKSQMSFDTDQWPDPARKKAEASLRAYNKDQAFKAKRWKQKQEYKALKAAFPEEAPGSFAGYLQSAKHKGPKWQQLQKAKIVKGQLIEAQGKKFIISEAYGKRIIGFDTQKESDEFLKLLLDNKVPGIFKQRTQKEYMDLIKNKIYQKPAGLIDFKPQPAKATIKTAKKQTAAMKAAQASDAIDNQTIIKAAGKPSISPAKASEPENIQKINSKIKAIKQQGDIDDIIKELTEETKTLEKARGKIAKEADEKFNEQTFKAVDKSTETGKYTWFDDYVKETGEYYKTDPEGLEVLTNYTGPAHKTYNGYLRMGDYNEYVEKELMKLDNLINNAPPIKENIILHRGLSNEPALTEQIFGDSNKFMEIMYSNTSATEKTKSINALANGRQFIEKGYSSTSYGPDVVYSYRPITMEIYMPAGKKYVTLVDEYTQAGGLKEVLFRRGQKFQIKEIEVIDGEVGPQTIIKVLAID